MKPWISAAAVVLFFFVPWGAAFRNKTLSGDSPQSAGRGSVVVELFTSEGCSSCPPADALLAKLSSEPSINNAEVIALEEHVDYWDSLGWKDPFSSGDATLRQNVYAHRFGGDNAYTPQMVVDGVFEFVGSREGQARKTIAQAATAAKVAVVVTLGAVDQEGSRAVQIQVGKIADPAVAKQSEIRLAVTESGLHSAVTRGENAGEDLHHGPVVRLLRKVGSAKAEGDRSFSGEAKVKLDSHWKPENVRVAIFVQDQKTKRMVGAAARPW